METISGAVTRKVPLVWRVRVLRRVPETRFLWKRVLRRQWRTEVATEFVPQDLEIFTDDDGREMLRFAAGAYDVQTGERLTDA